MTGPRARYFNQQRYVQGVVIKEQPMAQFSMLPKSLAMVGHHHEKSVLVKAASAQSSQQPAHRGVHVGNFAVVGRRRVLGFKWRWRIIRIVRVIEMKPEKKRSAGAPIQPSQGLCHHLQSPAFDTVVAILTRAAGVKWRVICVEAAVKSRC